MVVLRQVEDGDLDPFFEHWNDDDALQMAAFTPADAKDRAAFEERVVGSGRGYANARGAEVDEVLFQLDV